MSDTLVNKHTSKKEKFMTHKYIGEIVLQPSQYIIQKIMADLNIKSIIAATTTFVTYVIFEDTVAIGVLLGFIMLDWITGVWAAIKTHTFTSSRFRATVIKVLIYMIIIAMFHSLERITFIFTYLKLDVMAASYLACTEVISILENFTRISRIHLPDWVLKNLKAFQQTGKVEISVTDTHSESSVDGGPKTTVDTSTTSTMSSSDSTKSK
jgi:phage-related holin